MGSSTTRTDTSHYAAAEHRCKYDGLYQLTEASGDYTNYPYGPNAVTGSNWKRSCKQTYEYDAFFNMSRKTSSDRRSPMSTSFSSLLNYELAYKYSPEKPHQAARIGERYYGCDANGNLIEESSAPTGQSEAGEAPREQRIGDVRRVDQGWGYEFDTEEKENVYRRFFKWDSENRLTSVSEGSDVTSFLYDADGERTSKLGERGERLYFNAWWTANSDVPQAQPRNVANTTEEGSRYRYSKHIFVGSERIVTRLRASTGNWAAEDAATYWYHPDHLGSTSVVTDPDGEAYERIEYTPFGEMWLEHQHDANTRGEGYIPFRFTSKEWDEETGLYYYGARYLEPKLSRWMSADPAGWELINPMEIDGENQLDPKKQYSLISGTNWYAYVSHNPIKFIDPTGNYEVWFFSVVEDRNVYGIRRNTGGVVNRISDFTAFRNARTKVENWVTNLTEPGALIFDSTVSKSDPASFVLDVASFIPAVSAVSGLSETLTVFGMVLANSSRQENRLLEQRMFMFLESNSSTGILRNVYSNEEAIARTNLFAAGADAFFRYDLESKGISFDSWGDSLKNILNGKYDKQFYKVMGGLNE